MCAYTEGQSLHNKYSSLILFLLKRKNKNIFLVTFLDSQTVTEIICICILLAHTIE